MGHQCGTTFNNKYEKPSDDQDPSPVQPKKPREHDSWPFLSWSVIEPYSSVFKSYKVV